MVHAIQSDRIFLQYVTTNTGDAFAGVVKMIQKTFLPRLFFGNTKTLLPIVGALSNIPVKKPVLGILNTVTSEKEKYLSSQKGRAELIRAVIGGGAFS